ncbi:hypothetical protein Droror1_Dr00002464 [Drosera rotundifolia]
MTNEATASRLAWSWVIETLARSDEMGAPVIYDLISEMPELFDNLGKNAREAVALRCLESLFAPADGLQTESIHSQHSGVRIDSSKSCEDVLFHLSEEESLTNLSKCGLDHLKSDVRSFVEHKKASLPKCALNQLKDIILEGAHPLAPSLKKFSGLTVEDSCEKSFLSEDGEKIAPSPRNDQVEVNGGAALARDTQNSPSLLDGNKVRPEESQNMTTSKKRDKTCSSNGVCGLESLRDFNNCGPPSKKLKQSASYSLPQPECPLDSCDFVSPSTIASDNVKPVDVEASRIGQESKSGKVLLNDGIENVSQNRVGFPCIQFLVPGDGNHPLIASEDVDGKNTCATEDNCEDHLRDGVDHPEDYRRDGTEHHTDHLWDGDDHPKDHLRHGEENSEDNLRTRVLDDAPSGKDLENTTAIENQETKDPMDLEPGNITSNGKIKSVATEDVASDTGAKRIGYSNHHEEIDVDKEKHDFLSSQQLLSQELLATDDWTEKNLCVRCYKGGGELLSCSYNGCLVVIHESCLLTDATFDSRGRFYCPFCGYSRAISEYSKAKKKVSMARKVLSQFIGGSGGSVPSESSHPRMFPSNDPSCTNSTRNADKMDEGDHVENNLTENPNVGITRQKPLVPCSGGTVPVEDEILQARGAPLSSFVRRQEGGMVTEKQPFDRLNGPQYATEVNPCTDTAEETHVIHSPVRGNGTDVGVGIDPEAPSPGVLSQLKGAPCANGRQLATEVIPCSDTAEESHEIVGPVLRNETDVGVRIDPEVPRARIPSPAKGAPCATGLGKSVQSDHCRDAVEASKRKRDPDLPREIGNGVGIEHEVSRQPIPNKSRDAPSESISDPDGFGGDKVGSPSKYIFAGRQRKDHIPYEGVLQSRRKKVPWTAEEEDMLKEAMARFVENETRAIPWKIMLEFGRPVFLKCRTPGDLKDKWKNMQKKLSRGAKEPLRHHS